MAFTFIPDVRITMVGNPFDHKTSAERYRLGRPYFHPIPVGILRDLLALDKPLPLVLDVAAGTGLASRALLEVADCVIASDASPAMLSYIPSEERLIRLHSPGERLPLVAECLDLIMVCCAIHWLDQDRFYPEARRCLRTGRWLAVVDHGWNAELEGSSAFPNWARVDHPARYPAPYRHPGGWSMGTPPSGFSIVFQQRFEHVESMTRAQLIDYIASQSNVAAAIEQRGETIENVRRQLEIDLEPFFVEALGPATDAAARVPFRGQVTCLQKLEPKASGSTISDGG